MKILLRKSLVLMLVFALTIPALTGCDNGGGTTDTPTIANNDNNSTDDNNKGDDSSDTTDTPKETRDLGGLAVTIGNWWASEEEAPPASQQEEDVRAYRNQIQADNNFTIKEVNLGGWAEFQEIFITSTMAQDPAASIFVMDSSFVAQPLNNGLFYPLSDLEAFDFTEEKWNKEIYNLMTIGGTTYGMVATSKLEPRGGIFWNKRLYEEAGLEPDLPYDLQASGEWTWEKFKEICQALTRDTNSDGVMDTYAIASFSKIFFTLCAFTNDAQYVGRGDDGKFFNATGEPNFLEAMQFGRSIFDEGYIMPKPEGAEWNWFTAAFHDGQVAMQAAEQHSVSGWADMEDDWGFVLFPKGPKGESKTVFNENIIVLPTGIDRAEDIAYAYNLYTEPLPDYNDPDDWKTRYYSLFRDERAVDETLAMIYDGHGVLAADTLVYGLDRGAIVYGVDAGSKTPAEAIKEIEQVWNALIEEANNSLK